MMHDHLATPSQAAQEGIVEVPGGCVRYRLLPAAKGPTLVFENGWAASHEQWAWVERELAGHASLLFYSHAGIGGGTLQVRQSPAGLSAQFAALLDELGISQPVVLVGHSFGGLISALHAAQQADRVFALVQLDNTPEIHDRELDSTMPLAKALGSFAALCARLHIPDPLFSKLGKFLPAEEGERMQELSLGSASSMKAALVELGLLTEIRAAIAAAPASPPRLVISAGAVESPKGRLGRLLAKKGAQRLQRVHLVHRAQAQAPGSRWMSLPHSHGDLVFTAAGARDSAREIREFVAGLAWPERA